jgi:hypothetical protein
MKELLDKEVVIIDKEEYVKVLNPQASGGRDQPKYLYIPVNEYLVKKEIYVPITPTARKEESKKGSSMASKMPSPGLPAPEVIQVSPLLHKSLDLKKKVMVVRFDDRTEGADEQFGDWVTEKLIKEVNRRSQRILFVDYDMVKEFLQGKGMLLTELETPRVLHLLNEVFGIHALVVGQLSGPYVFKRSTGREEDGIASAIIKIEMRILDTLSGRAFKTLSANNPVLAAKEKGSFSEEKAKEKAIDITLASLSSSLSKELEGLEWFCRIAKVEGNAVYINAGRLTGLKVGDMMEVVRPGGLKEKGEIKGKIKISDCFGIDAAMGKLVQGSQPDIHDILRLAKET